MFPVHIFFGGFQRAGWIKPRKWFALFHHCCVFTSGWQPSTSFVLGSRRSIMNRSQYWTHRRCSACSQYKHVWCVVFFVYSQRTNILFYFPFDTKNDRSSKSPVSSNTHWEKPPHQHKYWTALPIQSPEYRRTLLLYGWPPSCTWALAISAKTARTPGKLMSLDPKSIHLRVQSDGRPQNLLPTMRQTCSTCGPWAERGPLTTSLRSFDHFVCRLISSFISSVCS